MSANMPVSADALAEIAWGEALPASPRAAVHSKVYRLRRLLGGDVIETVGEAYRLRADADELDLLRFESLVAGAAGAASDEETAATLADAIGLWRGDPLANTYSPVLASGDVPRLTERYLAACEQWARVSIRLRRAAEVVQLVAPLVDAHPFREPIVRLLMLALYQDGRQADALTVYDTLRRGLSEELGVDPSAALQDLHATILHGTPAESARTQPDPGQPRWPEPGPAPGRVTGRDGDMTALARAVHQHPAVTVTGPGGVPGTGAPVRGRRQMMQPPATPSGEQFTELHIGTLSEVRVALDPYLSVLALTTDALGRRRAAPQAWRRRILASLSPPGAGAVLPIAAPRYSVTPDCVTPLNPAREMPVHVQVEWLHAMPEDDLLGDIHSVFDGTPPPHWQGALRRPRSWLHAYATAMADAWRSVEPLWLQAQPMLEREVRRVGAAAVRGSLDLILDRLHPASQFDNNVLRIRDPEPASFQLGGRPLVLVPMLSGVQALICNLERTDAVWIAYPLPGVSQLFPFPKITRRAASDPLASVMGPMRAQILQAAERPLTMSELARLSRLAPSELTHHCERLATAGLVQPEKRGHEIWLSQTSRARTLIALFTEVG
jgi:DNA-binding SARP family transcriptional activator